MFNPKNSVKFQHVRDENVRYRVFTRSSKRPALRLLEVCWTFAGLCKHPPLDLWRVQNAVTELK